ncbi:MAG TPA: FeoA family protein [Vicinamibacterales bacterium]|nr:FeoA family protein [Vicinamibacterales bacterium]
MSSVHLAFSSRTRGRAPQEPVGGARPLSSLGEGTRGVVVEVRADAGGRTDRLLSLGVTPGASVVVLQTFPGIVLLCDQTELAVERQVADAILVRPQESQS